MGPAKVSCIDDNISGVISTVSIYGNFFSFTTQHLNFNSISDGNGFKSFTYKCSPTTTLLTNCIQLFWLKFNRYVSVTLGFIILSFNCVCLTSLI